LIEKLKSRGELVKYGASGGPRGTPEEEVRYLVGEKKLWALVKGVDPIFIVC